MNYLKDLFLVLTISELKQMSSETLQCCIKFFLGKSELKNEFANLNSEEKQKLLAILDANTKTHTIGLISVLVKDKDLLQNCYRWLLQETESNVQRAENPLAEGLGEEKFSQLLDIVNSITWNKSATPSVITRLILRDESAFERAWLLRKSSIFFNEKYQSQLLFVLKLPEAVYQAVIKEEVMLSMFHYLAVDARSRRSNFLMQAFSKNSGIAHFLLNGAITLKEILAINSSQIDGLDPEFKARDLAELIAKNRNAQNNNSVSISPSKR